MSQDQLEMALQALLDDLERLMQRYGQADPVGSAAGRVVVCLKIIDADELHAQPEVADQLSQTLDVVRVTVVPMAEEFGQQALPCLHSLESWVISLPSDPTTPPPIFPLPFGGVR